MAYQYKKGGCTAGSKPHTKVGADGTDNVYRFDSGVESRGEYARGLVRDVYITADILAVICEAVPLHAYAYNWVLFSWLAAW